VKEIYTKIEKFNEYYFCRTYYQNGISYNIVYEKIFNSKKEAIKETKRLIIYLYEKINASKLT